MLRVVCVVVAGIVAERISLQLPSAESIDGLQNQIDHIQDEVDLSYGNEGEYSLSVNDVKVSSKEKTDVQRYVKFVETFNVAPSDIVEVVTKALSATKTLSEELSSGCVSFAILFVSNPENLENLLHIHKIRGVRLLVSSNKEHADKLNCSFPGMYLFNSVDKYSYVSEIPGSLEALKAHFLIELFPKFDSEISDHIQAVDTLLFCVVDRSENYEIFKKSLCDSIKLYASKGKFIYFDPRQMEAPMRKLGLEEKDLPLLISVIDNNKRIIRNFDMTKFDSAIEDILIGNAEMLQYVVKLPEDNDKRDLKVLNTHTILEKLKDTSVDRYFFFFSLSCPHCKSFSPIINKVARTLKKKNVDVFFGEYNIIDNEFVDGYSIESVPKLFFAPKGSERMEEVGLPRLGFLDILKYVAEKGVSAKFEVKDLLESLEPQANKQPVPEQETAAPEAPQQEKQRGDAL